MAAVTLEVELALERIVDGFDDLAQRLEELGAGPLRLAFAGRAEQADAGTATGRHLRSGE
jgi:hypothetical protein